MGFSPKDLLYNKVMEDSPMQSRCISFADNSGGSSHGPDTLFLHRKDAVYELAPGRIFGVFSDANSLIVS